MFKATLYAALRHWSPRANRSAPGSFEIASLEWTASATASCHARSLRKSPMPKSTDHDRCDYHQYRARGTILALIQRTVVASYGDCHSHSIVAGGLELTSYTTRFTPFTSLMIRLEMRPSTSGANGNQSAVIPSRLVTARRATTWS